MRNCAIFDKSTKLSGVLAYGMKFIFSRGGIKFSDLGGPAALFMVPPKIGHNHQTLELQPYFHFQRSDFHKFDIKLSRKERPLNEKSTLLLRQNAVITIPPCPCTPKISKFVSPSNCESCILLIDQSCSKFGKAEKYLEETIWLSLYTL